jgi:hypothetical protein
VVHVLQVCTRSGPAALVSEAECPLTNTSQGHSIGGCRCPFPIRLYLSHLEMLGLLHLTVLRNKAWPS